MEQIKKLQDDLLSVVERAKTDRRDAEFYLRVLIQAVLTHGQDGVLEIDSSKAELAKNAAAYGKIEFGGGMVKVYLPRRSASGV